MYFDDHNPPHFHAEYQEDEALIAIQTLEILEGRLPGCAHALVMEWAAEHREELMSNWHKAILPAPLTRIAPLD